MHHQRYLILISGLFLFTQDGLTQGCSDAGVCTVGPIGQLASHADSAEGPVHRHYAKLQYSYAVGEQDVVIMQVQPEISVGLTERSSLQLKVPFISASGNLGNNSGLGDVILIGSYQFVKEHETNLTGIVGFRLPTGATSPQPLEQTTFGSDFKPLPMPYQPGLGTFDLLLGAQYRHKRWTTTLAYQHVLSQQNENLFYRAAWRGDPRAAGYVESLYLERANDLVARLQCALPIGKLKIQPGVLAIYHLGLDGRLEEELVSTPFRAIALVRRDIQGSDGLTLNITADARYPLNDAWSLEAALGAPVITREVRPDGLTRSMVLNMGLRYAF